MEFFTFIPSNIHHGLYLSIVLLCCLFSCFYYSMSENDKLQTSSLNATALPALVLSLFLILLLGLRSTLSVDSQYFGDTWLYTHTYNNLLNDYSDIELGTEWLWNDISFFCKNLGLDASNYFLVIEFLYFIPMILCCWLLMRNNLWLAVLFCVVSFSFYSYGVNGIRNGVSCSFVMLSIALMTGNKVEKILGILFMIIAYFIHNSVLLPCVCIIVSLLFIRDTKYAIFFWVISIFISLIAGNFIGDFFADLGFDERTSYFEDVEFSEYAGEFSSTGFRFDFLFYSSIPIFFIWYLTLSRDFKDKVFNLIANTYILANAFWVMVIRATYSNRFAYLSWFLYPIVIAYPLIRFKIWENQDRKASLILFVYSLFTLMMFFRN